MQDATKALWFEWLFYLSIVLFFLYLIFTSSQVVKAKEKEKQLEEEKNKLIQQLEVKAREKEMAREGEAPKSIAKAPVVPTNNSFIVQAIYDTFGTDPRIIALVNCESGMNPSAVGYDASYNQYNYGLFQVSQYQEWSYEYLMNPYNNIKVGKIILDRQGFSALPSCAKQVGLLV